MSALGAFFSAGVSVTILQIFLNPKIVDILTSVAKRLGSDWDRRAKYVSALGAVFSAKVSVTG